MLRAVGGLLAVLAAAYLAFAAALALRQRAILFPAPRLEGPIESAPLPQGARRIVVPVPGGRTEAWLLPPLGASRSPAPLVVAFHGNGETIGSWVGFFDFLRRRGAATLLVEYPGYGRSTGSPGEGTIAAAASGALDAALAGGGLDPQRVALFGSSLGAAAAMSLAERRPAAAVVLLSAFTSTREFARRLLLPGFLVRDRFDTLARVRRHPGPLLILHGREDGIVPFGHGERLAAAAADARFVPLGCGHNDCVAREGALLRREILGFLERTGVLAAADQPRRAGRAGGGSIGSPAS